MGTCEAMTFERIAQGRDASPVSSTIAAEVSSQLVSIPRIRIKSVLKLYHGGHGGHLAPQQGHGPETSPKDNSALVDGSVSSVVELSGCVVELSGRDRHIAERARERLAVRRPKNPSLGDD